MTEARFIDEIELPVLELHFDIEPNKLNFFSAAGVFAWITRLFSIPQASMPRARNAPTSSPLADPATSSL